MKPSHPITWDERKAHFIDWTAIALEVANRRIDPILKVLISAALVILLLSAVSLFSIAWHQLTLVGNNIYIPSLLKSYSQFVLEVFEETPPYAEPDKINARLSIIVGVLGAFATSFFSLAAAASTWYLQRKLKNSATVQTSRIFVEGKGDIRIMIREYLRGSRVVVFGGDFSWIGSPIAKNVIQKLVENNKIKFISYKSTGSIESELGPDLFKLIAPKISLEDSINGLKASLIYDSSGDLQSYLYQAKSADGDTTYVCKIHGATPDGRRLLRQILTLAQNYPLSKSDSQTPKAILVCGKSKTGKSDFCKAMSDWGYPTVSAGSLLREIFSEENGGATPSPIELLEFGKLAFIPGSSQAIKLKDKLLKKIEQSERPITVDGLRVPWLFFEIMKEYGSTAHFLLFTALDTEREERLRGLYKEAFSPDLQTQLENLDSSIDLLAALTAPRYRGAGGGTALFSFAATEYPRLNKAH